MNNIKKAINTGKMIPKRDILSMVRYEGKGLKKLGFKKVQNPKAGKFFKEAQSGGYAESDTRNLKDRGKSALKTIKKNPIKASIAADLILDQVYPTEHGAAWEGTNWLAKKIKGKDTKIPAPNAFDNWFLFGIPAGATIGEATGWW